MRVGAREIINETHPFLLLLYRRAIDGLVGSRTRPQITGLLTGSLSLTYSFVPYRLLSLPRTLPLVRIHRSKNSRALFAAS